MAYDDTRIREELFYRDVRALASRHGLIGRNTESPGVCFCLRGWRSWFSWYAGFGSINRRWTPLQVTTHGSFCEVDVVVYDQNYLDIAEAVSQSLVRLGYQLAK